MSFPLLLVCVVVYGAVAVIAILRLARGIRDAVGGQSRPHLGRIAKIAAASLAVLAATTLAAPDWDGVLFLGVLASFLAALAVGTRGRPLDFVDRDVRHWIIGGLPEEFDASKKATALTQFRVIGLMLAFLAIVVAISAAGE